MAEQKTHRLVNNPRISLRYLADYMASSEVARRGIIRGCKYQPIARIVQHDEAKQAVGRYIRVGKSDPSVLTEEAQKLRDRMVDSVFDRDVLDHNADYIDRFAKVSDKVVLPKADISAPGAKLQIQLRTVKLTAELQFRLRRVTKTNKIRLGAGTLRYAKGTPLKQSVGEWQSAILFGLISLIQGEDEEEAEQKLCVTIDAFSGACFQAPSDATRRFNNAEAACATIAEQWDNINPPENSVI
jgi:hypothetical protein